MLKLRPYQEEAVDAALDFFEFGVAKDTPIIVAPTGAGKSIIIAAITKKLGPGTLVLQPSKELLEQNYAKFRMYGGEASIYSASMKTKEIGDVTFATIGSIKKIPHLFDHVKHVLIDECHLVPPTQTSMFVTFLEGLPGVKVMGLTATAFRLKKYRDPFTGIPFSQINLLPRERPRVFNRFLHITQVSDLYENGFLAPVRYVELVWSNGNLKVNSTGAEYTDDSLERSVKEQKIYERLPGLIKQSIEKGRKHRLVFVSNVLDAQVLAKKVPSSACVHAGTKPKDREKILSDFKSGKILTVFNVGVLTVGFDFPELDTVIIARPTMSLTLYIQMVGRAVRTAAGKEYAVVVDMCGNVARFCPLEKLRYDKDEHDKWIITDGEKVLSGVKLST